MDVCPAGGVLLLLDWAVHGRHSGLLFDCILEKNGMSGARTAGANSNDEHNDDNNNDDVRQTGTSTICFHTADLVLRDIVLLLDGSCRDLRLRARGTQRSQGIADVESAKSPSRLTVPTRGDAWRFIFNPKKPRTRV